MTAIGIPKFTHARIQGIRGRRIFKVLGTEEAHFTSLRSEQVLVWDEERHVGRSGEFEISHLSDQRVIGLGDVVAAREGSSTVFILFRRRSRANVLFITERCNSRCLMCSQPPNPQNDEWRVAELLELIPLLDPQTTQLGITGGEPTLLGENLATILSSCRSHLPATELHVLTNGRALGNPDLASMLVEAGGDKTTWAIPLYADNPKRHDEIVRSDGAFAETLEGLAELASLGARVEIRVVLHALSLPRLPELAAFIYRRLPFVEHVALMGLEPMGYAKSNRQILWIDPVDFIEPLEIATRFLSDRGMSVSIYNLPLCVLQKDLWGFAKQSISDWKNMFAPECAGCDLRSKCSGFFASAGAQWRSRGITPTRIAESAA